MIREAMEAMGGKASNVAVRDWVLEHYPGTNPNTVQSQIIICTVNHDSRVHYPENQRPRQAEGEYDFLYRSGPGQLELYDPRIHGRWEIAQDPQGFYFVRRTDTMRQGKREEIFVGGGMIEEQQLRSHLARGLGLLEEGLELFVDTLGNDGIEYQTDIGPIDILAVDPQGAFVIIILQVQRTAEQVSGQALAFVNWVKQYLAEGRPVRGYIVGAHIADSIRYALANRNDIFLKEYKLNITLKDVPRA
jgi:hypothetical protein